MAPTGAGKGGPHFGEFGDLHQGCAIPPTAENPTTMVAFEVGRATLGAMAYNIRAFTIFAQNRLGYYVVSQI